MLKQFEELSRPFEEAIDGIEAENLTRPEAESVCEHFKVGKLKFSVLAKTDERYQTITFGPLEFKDSMRFLDAGLDKLVEAHKKNAGGDLARAFPLLAARHPHRDHLDHLVRKFKMPFTAITDRSVFARPAVLDREDYHNWIKNEPVTEEELVMQRETADALRLQNFGDVFRCYNECDVLQLADIIEGFRNTSRGRSGVDLAHYVGFPRLAMDTLLLRSEACIELVHKLNGGWPLLNDINNNVRGGLCAIFSRYAAANNPMTADLEDKGLGYDTSKPTTWILPLDINSLYPSVMTLPLPVGGYVLVKDPSMAMVEGLLHAYEDHSDTGYMVICDIWVDPSLHDRLDFAPVAKRATMPEELTKEQREISEAYFCKAGEEKLMPYLGKQEQVGLHIALLKYYVKLGVSFDNVTRVWKWRQEAFMKAHILENVEIRNRIPKGDPRNDLAKRESNGLYGMMLQNKEAYCNTTIHARHDSFVRAAEKPLMRSFHMFDPQDDGFLGLVHRAKGAGITVDTPRLVGWAILELSKRQMYRAWYDGVKLVWPEAQLLMMDTDSFHIKVESADVMGDITRVNAGDFGDFRIDASAVMANCPNENRLGVLKLEYHAAEFVGVRAKCYSELTAGLSKDVRKFKGMREWVVKRYLMHEDFKRIVLEPYSGLQDGRPKTLEVRSIQSKEHHLEHQIAHKKSLAPVNDKVYEIDGFRSRPLGHWRNST